MKKLSELVVIKSWNRFLLKQANSSKSLALHHCFFKLEKIILLHFSTIVYLQLDFETNAVNIKLFFQSWVLLSIKQPLQGAGFSITESKQGFVQLRKNSKVLKTVGCCNRCSAFVIPKGLSCFNLLMVQSPVILNSDLVSIIQHLIGS